MKKRKCEPKRSFVRFLRQSWTMALLIAILFSGYSMKIHAESVTFTNDTRKAESVISIDDRHKYEGMDSPFSKGYVPAIEKNTMTLVVPFVTDAKMEQERITVGIDFQEKENGPFYYKTYRKQVKLSKEQVYLYQCRIKLKKDRVNGQYPLYLWAEGKENGVTIRQEFTIYVEITDGKASVGDVAPGDGTKQSGEGGKNPGNGTGQFEGDGENTGDDSYQGGGDLTGDMSAGENNTDPSVSSEEEKNSQPRLMIRKNSLQGKAVEAGNSETWTVSVLNCSSRHAVENIKVTLLTDSKDIVFEKTAWYFEKIAAKTEIELTQNITVVKKASDEPVQAQFQIEYEDEKGNAYTTTEEVRLLVAQPQQAELAGLTFPEQVYASDTEFLTFQVRNTGLSPIYNVKVCLKAKGLFPQQEVFLGNIEGGLSADGEQKVFVGTLDMDEDGNVMDDSGEKYGDTSGEVILSYEDEQGEVTEQKMEIHTSIKEAETLNLEIEEQKTKTNQWWVTILFLVILVLTLVIVWLYLRMKHYKNMRNG